MSKRGIPHLRVHSASAKKLVRHLEKRGAKLGPLLIVTHDHPDPDALASAWCLARLVQHVCGVRSRIVYSGVIVRRENLLMLENLWIPARPIRKADLECKHSALVDTQPPFRNNSYPARRKPAIIVDHHPRNRRTKGSFVLIDMTAGATATIMAEALLLAEVPVSRRLATAIVYGIAAETQNLGRGAERRDTEAYLAYLPLADMKAIWRITNPPRPDSFFKTLARAIRDAFVCGNIIGVHLREISDPHPVAQVADFLLTQEKMRWSLATGRYQGKLHVSLRTHSRADDAGKLLSRIMGGSTKGGGHPNMAGGSVVIGMNAPERKWREAEDRFLNAFLKSRGFKDRDGLFYPYRHGA